LCGISLRTIKVFGDTERVVIPISSVELLTSAGKTVNVPPAPNAKVAFYKLQLVVQKFV
jgi:hypothetical protein